ncbi:hypothetical protein HaLaN_28203, partial [Haematococcus lacustris]
AELQLQGLALAAAEGEAG